MGIDGGFLVQNSIQFAYIDGSYFRAFQVKRIKNTSFAHVIRALADISNGLALFSITKIDLRRRSENVAIASDVNNHIKHTPAMELEEFETELRTRFLFYLLKTLENADFRPPTETDEFLRTYFRELATQQTDEFPNPETPANF